MDISIRIEPVIPVETSIAVDLEKFLHKLWIIHTAAKTTPTT
jgi:hypothetical protein